MEITRYSDIGSKKKCELFYETNGTIIKMAGAVRSFGRRTFYNSTCATVWTYGTNENTAVFDKVSSTDGAPKKYSLGLYE